MTTPLIACHDLVIGWQGTPLLPPINMQITRGRVVAVLGRNGSGKSTWFQTILGQARPISGRVERSPELDRIAYIPQSTAFDKLLPLRARDVVMQGRLSGNNFLRPFASRGDKNQVKHAMQEAGVSELADEDFRDLSRGQRQRVMFARVLATEAQMALLDEPTAAMDVVSERDAMQRLAKLAREHDIAVVIISHALAIAEHHADDVLFLDRAANSVLFGRREEILASDRYREHMRGDDDAS